MSLVVSHIGAGRMLELILASELMLRLYANDCTPTVMDEPEDLVELKGRFGYRPKNLEALLWTIFEGDESNPTYAAYPKQIFDFAGRVDPIFGYFIEAADGVVMWAERFIDGPYELKKGGRIGVTPRFEIRAQ